MIIHIKYVMHVEGNVYQRFPKSETDDRLISKKTDDRLVSKLKWQPTIYRPLSQLSMIHPLSIMRLSQGNSLSRAFTSTGALRESRDSRPRSVSQPLLYERATAV